MEERGGGDALALLAGHSGGLSQADIIQEQALAIAELEDKVARAAEYKALTKTRLKEAAQRLREYRLRAEELAAELAAAKGALAAAETESEAEKRRRPMRREVAVQTEVPRRRTADAGAQTEISGPVEATRARGRDQGAQTEKGSTADPDVLDMLLGPAVESTTRALRPVDFDVAHSTNSLPLPMPFPDATSAAIDAELAMSDSEDESVAAPALAPRSSNSAAVALSDTGKLNIDDEISSAIDEELGRSSEEEEEPPVRLNDSVGAAVDAELATSDSEDEQEAPATPGGALKSTAPEPNTRGLLLQSIDDEIDAELGSSSDEEAGRSPQAARDSGAARREATATAASRLSISSSSGDSSSESSDTSDEDGDKERNASDADDAATDKAEEALAGEAAACQTDATSPPPLGSTHSNGTSALAMALGRAAPSDKRYKLHTVEEGTSCDDPSSSPLPEAGEIKESLPEDVKTAPATRQEGGTSDSAAAASPSPSTRKRGSDDMDSEANAMPAADEPKVKRPKVRGDGPESPGDGLDHSTNTTRAAGHARETVKGDFDRGGEQQSLKPAKKRDLYLLKARQSFRREIMRVDGEEMGERYLGRTFAALVRCSAPFFESHPKHVTSLCATIAKLYRDSHVSPLLALHGALRVFRTPRSRSVLKQESMRLGELCQRVLLELMRPTESEPEALATDASAYWELDQCLDVLRGVVMDAAPVMENSSAQDTDAAAELKIRARPQSNTASHEKGFLAHVCALHTQLCRAAGQLRRSRVFLLDVVRLNMNIKGLQLAAIMVETAPELLATELDRTFHERHMVLKDVVLHVLVLIASVASMRQQELDNETGVEMLHRISRAIQREDLDELDGASPSFQREFVASLSRQVLAAPDALMASAEAAFQVGKSVELLVAFHGTAHFAAELPLSRLQALFREHDAAANRAGKAWAATICGCYASSLATSRDGGAAAKAVGEAVAWFAELLATRPSEEATAWQLPCAAACVDIALGAAAVDLGTRRRGVQLALRWFDQQPTEALMQLPGLFIRRLRLAVLSTRPPSQFGHAALSKGAVCL